LLREADEDIQHAEMLLSPDMHLPASTSRVKYDARAQLELAKVTLQTLRRRKRANRQRVGNALQNRIAFVTRDQWGQAMAAAQAAR
jgi:hypothetical protein